MLVDLQSYQLNFLSKLLFPLLIICVGISSVSFQIIVHALRGRLNDRFPVVLYSAVHCTVGEESTKNSLGKYLSES